MEVGYIGEDLDEAREFGGVDEGLEGSDGVPKEILVHEAEGVERDAVL